jgi:hypothetical protein
MKEPLEPPEAEYLQPNTKKERLSVSLNPKLAAKIRESAQSSFRNVSQELEMILTRHYFPQLDSTSDVVKQVSALGNQLRLLISDLCKSPDFFSYFKNEHRSSAAYYTAHYIAKDEGWGNHVTPTRQHWKEEVLGCTRIIRSQFSTIPDSIEAKLQEIETELDKD